MEKSSKPKTRKTVQENVKFSASIGKVDHNAQITVADTGWNEQQKAAMHDAGYDDMDMIRAWYS